jgi:hypothetical protein
MSDRVTNDTENVDYNDNDVVSDSDVDETTETEVEDWTPPTKDEWEELMAEKKKAVRESISRKKLLREHGIDPATGARKNADGEEAGLSREEFDRQVGEARAEAIARAKVLIAAVPKALQEAGWNGTGYNTVMKVLDLDSLEIEDGHVDGLTDQIDALKADMPSLFKRTKVDAAPRNVAGVGKKETKPTVK